jgi:hypothetical protein
MPPIRFRSRHLHATFVNNTIDGLGEAGWMSAPVNFGTAPVTVIDYQPDDREKAIAHNTVAVSLGDYAADNEEELGALTGGGLNSALYGVYIDVYMAEAPLAIAICDDIRDLYKSQSMPLINQISGAPEPNHLIQVDQVLGPEKPPTGGNATFQRYWRIMRVDARLYFQT